MGGPGTSPKRQGGMNLRTAVTLWPTPSANFVTEQDFDAWRERRERLKAEHKNGNGFGLTLSMAVQDAAYSDDNPKPSGSLNPTWVEWLMGFPLGWTALEPSETPSSRKSRSSSAD